MRHDVSLHRPLGLGPTLCSAHEELDIHTGFRRDAICANLYIYPDPFHLLNTID